MTPILARIPTDILEAIGLLTRLPIRLSHAPRGAGAAWAYPVAGALVAAIAGALALTLSATSLPALAIALIAVLAQVLLTGALHEDGIADWADGMGARGGAPERLAAMRDSATGAFGLIALIFSITLRAAAIAAIAAPTTALIAAAMLSRALMTLPMAALPHARTDGLAHLTGRPGWKTPALALALCLPALVMLPNPAIPLIAGALAAALPALWAAKRIGGQTGDILGASQQCAEIAILLAIAASQT